MEIRGEPVAFPICRAQDSGGGRVAYGAWAALTARTPDRISGGSGQDKPDRLAQPVVSFELFLHELRRVRRA